MVQVNIYNKRSGKKTSVLFHSLSSGKLVEKQTRTSVTK